MDRSSRRWAVAVCVAVLLAGAGVLVLTGFAQRSAAAVRDGVPPVLLVEGRAVPYSGPQAWTDASSPGPASRALTVYATGTATSGGGPCGPPAVLLRVRESAAAVRVLVAGYEVRPGLPMACPAIGYGPTPHTVALTAPLGSRAVIDASTGRRVSLLDGAGHPDLPHPPAGLVEIPIRQWEPGGPVSREWDAPGSTGQRVVVLTDEPPASVRAIEPEGRVALQTGIAGLPATVYRGVGIGPGSWFVRWTPNPRQTITLIVSAGGGHRWTAASALALARTVTGYRVEDTGRLGEPTVQGAAAATYNSADGPVRDVENLLKSSGVFVALDCRGDGRVAVTIRGSTRAFPCGSGLAHHAFESVGSADEPFTLSVDATPGVRWSLSLARASLDGS